MAVTKMIGHKGKSPNGMKQCIKYCLQESKVKQGYCAVTGPYQYETITTENVFKSFIEEKELWGKTTGRQYMHSVISFHKDDSITPEMALEFGEELCESNPMYNKFQCLICVHEDRESKHIHIVSNSVSFVDGLMESHGKPELRALKQHVDELCVNYGLKVTVKGQHFDGSSMEGEIVSNSTKKYRVLADNTKDSYLADCTAKVLDAMEKSASRSEFVEAMSKTNWRCEWSDTRKHIVFISEDGKRVRASNLAKTFHLDELLTKESLEAALNDEYTRTQRNETESDDDTIGTDAGDTAAEYGTITYDSVVTDAVTGLASQSIAVGTKITGSIVQKSNNEQKRKQRKGRHI